MLRAHAARPMHCSLVICGLRKLTMNKVLGPRPHTTCMHVLVMCSSLPLASYLVLQCQLFEQLVDPDSAFDAIFSYMATRYSHFAPLTTILFDDITFPDAFDTLDFPDPTLSASPHPRLTTRRWLLCKAPIAKDRPRHCLPQSSRCG